MGVVIIIVPIARWCPLDTRSRSASGLQGTGGGGRASMHDMMQQVGSNDGPRPRQGGRQGWAEATAGVLEDCERTGT